MLLDHNKFIVKAQTKGFSRKSFEILNPDSGQKLGTADDITGFFAQFAGFAVIEVRDIVNNALVFTVSRSGWLIKKVQVLDPQGQVIGRYKAKIFSLSGGFQVYDKDGKHLAEIQGKMLTAEYKFVTPDKTTEMGSVSKTWGGFAKSLLTGAGTYGVQIAPKFARDATAKILILGATIAIEGIFNKKSSTSVGGGGDD